MDNFLTALRDCAAPLVEPAHDSFGAAQQAMLRYPQTPLDNDPRFGWLRTHSLRAFALLEFEQRVRDRELVGWHVTGSARNSGALWLASDNAALRIRVLRDGKTGRVPNAGHNRARKAYYTNSLDPALFSLERAGTPECHRLLLLWTEIAEGDFAMRLVRPLTTGNGYRGRVQIDVDIPLLRSRSSFEDLTFEVVDEGLDDAELGEESDEV